MGGHNRKDLSGKRFGRLVAIKDVGRTRWGQCLWHCICDCGNTKTIVVKHLTSGKTRSCGCLQKEKASATQIAWLRSKKGKYTKTVKEIALKNMYRNYKSMATKRGLEFDLTREQFDNFTSWECHYCGAKPTGRSYLTARPDGVHKANGIDRVDNAKGYVLGNCVPCCKICNQMKSDMPHSEFIGHIAKIYKTLMES